MGHRSIILAGRKVMFIMRGVSGSGKSTKAQQLGRGGVVLGSDEFWGPDYAFDPARIGDAHRWNQDRAKEAIQKGISPIVIDNMNLQAWEAKPYVEAAMAAGYEVRIAQSDDPMWQNFSPDTPHQEKERILQELVRRNKHGVPEDTMRSMMDRWQHGVTVDDILKSKSPLDKEEEPWHNKMGDMGIG